ncbi:MAG: hypothetical protein N2559_06720 [Anaerolineae bacterium]|nr:hypothetical protein [Anaerolineae bacterium]
MNKKILLVLVGGLLFVCLACVGVLGVAFVLGLGATQPIINAGDSFMTALKNEDYTSAYNLCTPALQQELRNPQGLANLIRNANVRPIQWSYSSRNVSNDQGQLEGSVTFVGNREGTVQLVLTQVGGTWKIAGFRLREK